ncbi:hypothetical protein ACYOEI_37470, partial [Singulisphaera rosea]
MTTSYRVFGTLMFQPNWDLPHIFIDACDDSLPDRDHSTPWVEGRHVFATDGAIVVWMEGRHLRPETLQVLPRWSARRPKDLFDFVREFDRFEDLPVS